jgi:hypothetical protein
MPTVELVRLTRHRLERLFNALVDPLRGDRIMLLLLASYGAVWTLYGTIAKSSQDIHPDMGEMAAWSEEIGLGTPKHPPLGPWIVEEWFDVFPHVDWAYYLFAMMLATVALWVAWRVSAAHLPRDKRIVGIALLTLVSFYNFHALKFNANSVLTPLWAATTWWFLRSFETRRPGWAALAGVGAAAAILGKYWSAVLLAGLGFAALTDPRRKAYFSSAAPLVTLAVGTVLVTPHLDWLIANHFVPFTYATEAHPATFWQAAESSFDFLGGAVAYITAPVVLGFVAARPDAAAIADTLRPVEPTRRLVLVTFAAPLLIAACVGPLLQVRIEDLWAISAMTLLPVVLLSSPLITIPRAAAVSVLGAAIAYPLVMVLISPAVAVVVHRKGLDNYQDQYRLVAQALEGAWRSQTDKPLRIVGSLASVANGAAFYLASRPMTFDFFSPAQTPWVDEQGVRRYGMAMVCPEINQPCMGMLETYVAHYRGSAIGRVTLERRYWGMSGAPVVYAIATIPPGPQ